MFPKCLFILDLNTSALPLEHTSKDCKNNVSNVNLHKSEMAIHWKHRTIIGRVGV